MVVESDLSKEQDKSVISQPFLAMSGWLVYNSARTSFLSKESEEDILTE